MPNRKRETRSSDEEESEYSDVDVDSSGSEEVSPRQDIETGTSGKRNKKHTPKKKKTKETSELKPCTHRNYPLRCTIDKSTNLILLSHS